jgi:hypothetical protein
VNAVANFEGGRSGRHRQVRADPATTTDIVDEHNRRRAFSKGGIKTVCMAAGKQALVTKALAAVSDKKSHLHVTSYRRSR